jgi:tetratricopeptide (TPR) repeat protein
VRNNKAACYIELKQLDKAMETIEEALKAYNETPMEKRKFESFAKVLARKARILELQDNLDEAIEVYNKSLLENY